MDRPIHQRPLETERNLGDEDVVTGPEWACLKPLSWGAIIAGSLVAIAVGSLLNALGIGIGLAAFTTNTTGLTTLTVSGTLWLVVSTFIAMFVGGVVAGMLVRCYYRSFGGALHGFLVWSLASLLTVLIIGSVAVPTVSGLTQGAASNPAITTPGTVPDIRSAVNYPERSRAEGVRYNPRTDTVVTSRETERAINYAGHISLASFFVLLVGLVGALVGGRVGVIR